MAELEPVDIVKVEERPSTVTLADGTVLRVKVDVVDVSRFKDEWDNAGNPKYSVRSSTIVSVLSAKLNQHKA